MQKLLLLALLLCSCPGAPTNTTDSGTVAPDWILTQDWDFGSKDTITNVSDLVEHFDFHDPFGTVANGTNYGSTTVAPTIGSRVVDGNLPLPTPGFQPVEGLDVVGPFRTWTEHTMLMHVRPLSNKQETVGPAWLHNAGDGSIVAKYRLPVIGQKLGKDLKWETRIRMVPPPGETIMPSGYWMALWNVGAAWHHGPEIDVVESFSSTVNSGLVDGQAYNSNSIPQMNQQLSYEPNWWVAIMNSTLQPLEAHNLKLWHVFTLLYERDNVWTAYMDGHVIQQGELVWKDPETGAEPEFYFLFDGRAMHTATDLGPISTLTIPVSRSGIVFSYELDYSRVSLKE